MAGGSGNGAARFCYGYSEFSWVFWDFPVYGVSMKIKCSKSSIAVFVKGNVARRLAVCALTLLLAIFTALPSNAIFGLVLCFEEGGGVHVESLVASDTCAAERLSGRSFHPVKVDCHGCTDVTLGSPDSTNVSRRNIQNVDGADIGFVALRLRKTVNVISRPAHIHTPSAYLNNLALLSTVRILS